LLLLHPAIPKHRKNELAAPSTKTPFLVHLINCSKWLVVLADFP
jgi:hypothetical protein